MYDYTKKLVSELPTKYRKFYVHSMSIVPDANYFVHSGSMYVNSVASFPKRLSGNINVYYFLWYYRGGGSPYKAERRFERKDIRGRTVRYKKVVLVKPEEIKRVTVERMSVAVKNSEGNYFYFDPKRLMEGRLENLYKSVLANVKHVKKSSSKGSFEIIIPLKLIYWEFIGG